jgi:hypothetical protein
MHAKCESLVFEYCDLFIYSRYCNQPDCYGSSAIDFSIAFGLSEVLIPFMSKEQLDSSSSGECKIGSDNGCNNL